MHESQDLSRVESLIKNVLVEQLGVCVDAMTLDTPLLGLGLDSIQLLNLTIELEDRLGFSLTDLSMPAKPHLRDLVAVVHRNAPPQA